MTLSTNLYYYVHKRGQKLKVGTVSHLRGWKLMAGPYPTEDEAKDEMNRTVVLPPKAKPVFGDRVKGLKVLDEGEFKWAGFKWVIFEKGTFLFTSTNQRFSFLNELLTTFVKLRWVLTVSKKG